MFVAQADMYMADLFLFQEQLEFPGRPEGGFSLIKPYDLNVSERSGKFCSNCLDQGFLCGKADRKRQIRIVFGVAIGNFGFSKNFF